MTVVKIADSAGTQHDILSSKTMGLIRATKENTSTSTSFVLTAPGVTELYDGLTFIFRNDATASASGLVINLNQLGDKEVWASYQNARVTTGLGANIEYILYFDYANDRWVKYEGTYTANSDTIGEYIGRIIADSGGIKKNVFLMQTSSNPDKYTSIVNQSASTSTSKTKQTCGFIPNGRLYYYSGDDVAEGVYSGYNSVWMCKTVNLRYSFNISTTTLPESVIGCPVYIKCTMSSGLLYLADTWWATELPSTTDGFYYIYVGQMYSRYQCILHVNHPIYYYDGTQIQEFIYETSYIGQASGAVAHCPDAIDNTDFREILAYIQATQAGSGDPSPSNPRAITGWSGANVTRTGGKNILDPNATVFGNYTISPDGSHNEATDRLATHYLRCKGNTSYKAISDKKITSYTYAFLDIAFYDENLNYISRSYTNNTNNSFTFTTPANAKFLVYSEQFSGLSNVTPAVFETYDRCLIEGNIDSYEPFVGNTYTISFGGTYYGGYLNVTTGLLTVTHGIVDLGTLEWQYSATYKWFNPTNASFPAANVKSVPNNVVADIKCTIYEPTTRNDVANDLTLNEKCCVNSGGYFIVRDLDYDDTNLFKSAMNGVKLVYELATPQTYQLTPAQIEQLLGQNNVWVDSGDINVEYYRNTAIAHAVQDLAPIDHLGFWRDDNGCLCQG